MNPAASTANRVARLERHRVSGLPVVYACSGCSSAGQMANYVAVELDRRGFAEMSCVAGLGGNVRPVLDTARDAAQISVLDGCPLNCARRCLERHGIVPDRHYVLTEYGVRDHDHRYFDREQAERIIERVLGDLVSRAQLTC